MEENKVVLSREQVIQAWRDESFRNTLTAEQLAYLPSAPENLDELSDEELEDVAGGTVIVTAYCPIKTN